MGSPSPPNTPHSRSVDSIHAIKHDVEHDDDTPLPGLDIDDKGSPNTGGDAHQSLTSQSLNADGTPKRPMNAFMIFARRRRPQVSAANQMMRTGEISKILSREWNEMAMVSECIYLGFRARLRRRPLSSLPYFHVSPFMCSPHTSWPQS